MDPSDSTDTEVAQFRPRRRIRALVFAVGLNVALSIVFIGVPYVHGQWRAKEAHARFSRFAACIWGGEPISPSGLGLPAGERERFADRVLRGPTDWPARCQGLADVVGEPSVALLPRVSEAEEQVRTTVRLVERELRSLERARRTRLGRVPDRPHRAIGRLRAALAVLAETAGIKVDTAPAFRLPTSASRVLLPTRVPLQIAAGADLIWGPTARGLDVSAIGGERIARVRVEDRGATSTVLRRPSSARGLFGAPQSPWLVYATPETQCMSDPRRCEARATGVSPFGIEDAQPPPPRWIAGHPGVRLVDSLAHRGDRWRLIARTQDALEVRVFEPRSPGEEPVRALERYRLAGTSASDDARFIGDEVVFVRAIGEQNVELVAATVPNDDGETQAPEQRLSEPAELSTRSLGRFDGHTGWLVPCSSEASFVGVVTPQVVALVHVTTGRRVVSLPHAVGLRPARAVDEPVQLACDGSRVDLLVRTQEGSLRWSACDEQICAAELQVDDRVRHFAVERAAGTTLIAYAGDPTDGQIRVRRIAHRRLEDVVQPAACWTQEAGFCGQPYLAFGHGRWLVGARDGGDLLVVESTDHGVSFVPMQGLR